MSSASPLAEGPSPFYAWAAVALAALASVGGLYLTLIDKKVPCPLCFYQRSFALGALAVLLVGLLGKFNGRVSVATLALPLAFAGLGVALFHVRLERTDVLECPKGAFGLSTAPMQSAVVFGLLCAALVLDAYQAGRFGGAYWHVLGAAAGGLVIAGACLIANPKLPDAPKEPYKEKDPSICRPPYKEPAAD
jgi:disulfide bond formation protein DsbB